MSFTIGSLFDGSGGFPLAASMCGGVPKWASEVEPYPIAVTRSRFPKMVHLGDISKINGAEIEPVDAVSFGSPCQSLSVAGKREGLKHTELGDDETTLSGMFMEAVRVIKEMRANEKRNGRPAHMVRPRFAVWENVPGAFSSNGGEDFRTVLQELIKIVEPETPEVPAPDKNGWSYADCIVGDGWSIAWRVFDAQYWGVPQRRRRIHLVVDFAGECAGEILFEREGVRGYFAEGGSPWQGAAADAERSTGADDREGAGVTTQYLFENHSQDARYKGPLDVCPMLPAQLGTGGNNQPFVVEKEPVVFDGSNVTSPINVTNPQPGDPCHTLSTDSRNIIVCPVYCIDGDKIGKAERAGGSGLGIRPGDTMYTLTAKDAGTHAVCFRYIVRRLTPTECARLQGFPDEWGHPDHKADFSNEEYRFWMEVRNTHAAINGKAVKEYTKEQMLKWYNGLHTDSAEYKMWGNGIALPPALYVMQGIVDALKKEDPDGRA